MFREVEINIPLLDAIKQIPKYTKFLKELCVHKRKKIKGGVESRGIVSALTKNDDIITRAQQALPKKCRDLGIFFVPCTIGDCTFVDVMLDLGASINKSLNFGDLEPTGMTIQLANISVVQPLGPRRCSSPIDFYVMDMEDETSGKGSTLILGQPFLMTARTKIDVHVVMLSMVFGDNLVQFNIFEAMKHPIEDYLLFGIYLIDELVEEHMQLDTSSGDISNFAGDTDVFDCLGSITDEADYDESWEVHNLSDSEDDITDLADLSLEAELLDLLDQLKPLLSHLKYAYLDAEQQLPEERLLHVLRQHKKAIGWKLSDLPIINLSICMHKILMEEEAQPIRQQQRRLNPTILDVVKKEVTKLTAVEIIYPISDNQWVSLVQVVPKKFGMIVMKNQHDELVPMQIQNSWRVYIDYRKLNQGTHKDHFPLPSIDQVLEKLAGKSHYFLGICPRESLDICKSTLCLKTNTRLPSHAHSVP
ncbi:hypothetical protein CR513_48321, partial [Mucuna pruriens]